VLRDWLKPLSEREHTLLNSRFPLLVRMLGPFRTARRATKTDAFLVHALMRRHDAFRLPR
jgi:hypothetical protein